MITALKIILMTAAWPQAFLAATSVAPEVIEIHRDLWKL